MGRTYGIILLAWGLAAIPSPTMIARIHQSIGKYAPAISVITTVTVCSLLLALIARRPSKGRARAQEAITTHWRGVTRGSWLLRSCAATMVELKASGDPRMPLPWCTATTHTQLRLNAFLRRLRPFLSLAGSEPLNSPANFSAISSAWSSFGPAELSSAR